jgi:heat shock protein HslJ
MELFFVVIRLYSAHYQRSFDMRKYQSILCLSLLVLSITLVTGCALPGIRNNDPLNETSWHLLYYRKSSPIPGTELHITFRDGTFQGSSGCNSYGGSYRVENGAITTWDIYSTEMYCMDPEGIMDQESYYLESLQQAVRFQIDGDRLIIHRPGQDTLTFQR